MRKRLTALVLATTVSLSLAACAPSDKEENTEYTIVASLSADNILTASVSCDYVNNNDVPLDELQFHLYPNAYREGSKYSPIASSQSSAAYPSGKSYSELDIKTVSVNGAESQISVTGVDENILSVALPSRLEPTEHVTVQIEYTLKLPKVRHRLGYTDKSVNLANFYPIACVYRDGAFVADPYYSTGDPFFSETADYDVTFTAPSAYTGAFTGVVENSKEDGELTTYNITATDVRDFAAVFGKYEKVSGLAGSAIVNYYYHTDSAPESALNTAIAAIKTFGDMFGEYPYPEFSVVQTGFIHGGMEYPGLVMISDSYSGDAYNDIIVHETAHQWWYGVVGNDEVKYAWLDEGLAEYSTMMFYEQNEGYKYTFAEKRADALTAYMVYCETFKNNGLGDTSMTRPSNEYGDETEYSYMTYVKGALMLDDVRNTIGDSAFKAALKKYYADNKFGIAEPQDLIGAMEKASKRQLDVLFDSWLDGNVKLYSTH